MVEAVSPQSSPYANLIDNTDPFYIFARGTDTAERFMDADITGMGGTKTALSIAQLDELYDAAFDVATEEPNAYVDEVLADNPAGFWRLDETSGSTAVDLSGNGNDGTYTGTTPESPLTPSSSGSRRFDGVDDYMGTPWFNELGGSEYTMEAWVDLDLDATGRPVLISHRQTDEIGFHGALIRIRVDLDPPTFNPRHATSATNINNLTWASTDARDLHHVVVTWDGSVRRLYVDGVQEATIADGAYVPAKDKDTIPYGLTIGVRGDYDGGQSNFLKGVLQDMAYYDHALDASRVQAHYDAAFEETEPDQGSGLWMLIGGLMVPVERKVVLQT